MKNRNKLQHFLSVFHGAVLSEIINQHFFFSRDLNSFLLFVCFSMKLWNLNTSSFCQTPTQLNTTNPPTNQEKLDSKSKEKTRQWILTQFHQTIFYYLSQLPKIDLDNPKLSNRSWPKINSILSLIDLRYHKQRQITIIICLSHLLSLFSCS